MSNTVSNKIDEVENRFNRLTSSQQQSSEVIDARDGETSLKARLDRDVKEIYTYVEGANISVNSSVGYTKDVEIVGNTIQNTTDLADIRSVGDKIEDQELYKISLLITNGLDSSDSNYQEDKLAILSPVQLEKVGNVADRIICKDGIWGVEKSIETIYTKELDGNKFKFEDKTNTFLWSIVLDTLNAELVSSFMPIGTLSTEKDQTQIMIYNHNTYRELRMAFSKLDYPNFDNISNVKEYLNSIGKYIKIVQTPQFIPLPNDQQVKIRTFANKTNISLETEIEGTIKAQVPKTLGATVSIHNEQIDNLYQELEKIKQLLTENK